MDMVYLHDIVILKCPSYAYIYCSWMDTLLWAGIRKNELTQKDIPDHPNCTLLKKNAVCPTALFVPVTILASAAPTYLAARALWPVLSRRTVKFESKLEYGYAQTVNLCVTYLLTHCYTHISECIHAICANLYNTHQIPIVYIYICPINPISILTNCRHPGE